MITEETYLEMKNLISQYEIEELNRPILDNVPYIEIATVEIEKKYNPIFGDDKVCKCGHAYYRHFDSYEDMYNIGCKYCECYNFEVEVK